MTPHGRTVLVVGLILLGLGEFSWVWYRAMADMTHTIETQFPHVAVEQAQENALKIPLGKSRSFTDEEVDAFVAKARTAEDIADPLQRCLKYPDPPGSHWSPAAVDAYCHYRFQSVISFAEVQDLIRSGHAADLDRRLAEALQAQLTQPHSRGLVHRIFWEDFYDGSFDTRQTLDAWKRASPDSAFVLAASGVAYVAMAHKARGGALIRDTSDSNIESMDRLLQQADTDLQRAIQLNPKITPAYEAMMDAGSMSLGDSYTDTAFRRGTVAVPDDYAIYSMYIHVSEPKWGGSLQAMKNVADGAQVHAKTNPMLALLLAEEPAYYFNACDCALDTETHAWAAFPTVFDNVSSANLMFDAGYAANGDNQPKLGVVYLSEGLRFAPATNMAHVRRAYALTNVGDTDWALVEAGREIRKEPQSAWGYSMRGYAYKALHSPFLAVPDLEKANALDPDNTFPLAQLGWMYVNAGEWDKAWDVSSRLMHDHPDQGDGWLIRYYVQKNQPRSGLDDTMHHFIDTFGNDPYYAHWTAEMRAALAAESGTTIAVGKGVKSLR